MAKKGQKLGKVVVKKTLTKSEKGYGYIKIPGRYRKHFSPFEQINVYVKNKIQKVKIDNYYRIRLGPTIFHLSGLSSDEITTIVMRKEDNNVYSILGVQA